MDPHPGCFWACIEDALKTDLAFYFVLKFLLVSQYLIKEAFFSDDFSLCFIFIGEQEDYDSCKD